MTVLGGAGRCRCTPPSLKRIPSASSAETTRCRARALALGTLPLDPSQAVRQGREIEARSASSCCERPVRLRAARNMPPVISTIVMLRLLARRQRTSMSAYFTNSLTAPRSLGVLASLPGGVSFPRRHRLSPAGSAGPGRSKKDGLPSCRGDGQLCGSRPSTRAQIRTDARGRDGGVRQEAGDGNRPPRHWQKKTPHRGRMRGLFGYPSSLLDGERRRQGVAKRPPLPAEMSDALTVTSNATIVCSIPDSLVRISLRWPALPLARPLVRSGAAPWMAKRAGLENCAVGLPKRYP